MDNIASVCYAIAWHTMEGCHKRCHGNDQTVKVLGKTDSGRTYSQDLPGHISWRDKIC